MKIAVNLKENSWAKIGALWMLLLAVLKVTTMIQVPFAVTNLLLIGVSFILVMISYSENQENKWESFIFIAAFVLHMTILFADLYGKNYVSVLYSGKDTEVFFDIAKKYYHGDFSETLTFYPYFLNFFFKFIGVNRVGVQYINVLAWCFSMILMEKCCKELEISGKLRFCAIFLMAFMPIYMCMSSILLRESIIILMNMCWFYCQIKWMKDGNHRYLLGCFIAPIVSTALHMSAIVFLGITVFVLALYDFEKKQLRIQKKTVMILLAGIVGLVIFMLIPMTRRLITLKLPDFDEGFLNTINETIAIVSKSQSGSMYLKDVYVNGFLDFFLQTFVRIFYFFASPLPVHWRGLADTAAFAMSSCFYLFGVLISLVTVFVRKKDSYRTLMWLIFLTISGINCWGVFNAATAMRHRDKMIGAGILLIIYSANIVLDAWKNRRTK